MRPLKEGEGRPNGWIETAGATVDTTRPYLVRFESGVSIAVFLLQRTDFAGNCV